MVLSAESLVLIAEHRIPETEAEVNALPNPLRQLIATAGVKLVAAPCGTWNFDGYAAKLRWPLSVTFSVDAVVSSEEVLEAVCNTGIAAEEIKSIQYRGSNRSWCVSFVSRATKDRLLERRVIQLGNAAVCSNQVLSCTFSDHDFICLELGAFSTRHCGIWKFNTKLLKDPDFQQSISSLVLDQKSKIVRFDTLGDWWDNLKILIRILF